MRSEKCIVKLVHHFANLAACTYASLDGAAYYTPRIHVCMLLYKTTHTQEKMTEKKLGKHEMLKAPTSLTRLLVHSKHSSISTKSSL